MQQTGTKTQRVSVQAQLGSQIAFSWILEGFIFPTEIVNCPSVRVTK